MPTLLNYREPLLSLNNLRSLCIKNMPIIVTRCRKLFIHNNYPNDKVDRAKEDHYHYVRGVQAHDQNHH